VSTFGSYLLREVDPFASCAADAAIFYAVSDCGDDWWRERVWSQVRLSPHCDCADWVGDIVANPAEVGRVLGRPTVHMTKPGFSSGVYVRVHRLLWAWAFGYGELPDAKQTDFSTDEVITMTCWNPLCVSVAHMEKVDRTEMGRRSWAREQHLNVGV
jgi:hypothetical protein